jgi:hypothetical protein
VQATRVKRDSAKVESTLAALKECAAKELIIIIGIAVLAFATTAGAATQHSSVLRAQVCSRSLTLWTKPVPTRRINALRPFRDECVPFKLVVGWR